MSFYDNGVLIGTATTSSKGSYFVNWNTKKATKGTAHADGDRHRRSGKLADVGIGSRHSHVVLAAAPQATHRSGPLRFIASTVAASSLLLDCSGSGSRLLPFRLLAWRGQAGHRLPILTLVNHIRAEATASSRPVSHRRRRDLYSPLLVIRDQSTQGRRFYLKGIQASECLSFLKANPEPSERDVRAACPGAIRRRLRTRSNRADPQAVRGLASASIPILLRGEAAATLSMFPSCLDRFDRQAACCVAWSIRMSTASSSTTPGVWIQAVREELSKLLSRYNGVGIVKCRRADAGQGTGP